jgi:three-Cys-motif partner protein
MAPESVIWKLDDHTLAKHIILRKYLEAWLPILVREGSSGLLVDGFAGPGEYQGGYSGSPLIMIDTYQQHRSANVQRGRVKFLFVELKPERANHLSRLLEDRLRNLPLPDNATYQLHTGTFVDAMTGLLNNLASGREQYDAMFFFIDPFGFSHTPMKIVQALMSYPRSEVLITFMHEEINRFLDDKSKSQHYDALFGTTAWRTIPRDCDVPTRERYLHDLYRQQLLTTAGARYVRSFCMRNKKNSTDYFLFFATKHRKGMEQMKRAMWKVDPTGNFVFSDCTGLAQRFLLENDDPAILARMLLERFQGQCPTLDEIEEFVIADTPFFKYKPSLKQLEEAGQLVVHSRRSRRKGTYADPTLLLRFC